MVMKTVLTAPIGTGQVDPQREEQRQQGRRGDLEVLRPSEPLNPLPESRHACLHVQIVLGGAHQNVDAPHAVGLLRARRVRPRCRAADYGNAFPPPHVEHRAFSRLGAAQSVYGTLSLGEVGRDDVADEVAARKRRRHLVHDLSFTPRPTTACDLG
jgi:hypothetical protein